MAAGSPCHIRRPPNSTLAMPRPGVILVGLNMHRTYTWEYRIEMPPYDKLVTVVEAFFCSYPAGDYTCEHRETYKLRFRRGQWKKALLGFGRWMPLGLVKGQFSQWPMVVQALIRPSP